MADGIPGKTAPVPAIEVRRITKIYGHVRAVSNVSFTVMPGEIVGFLGPNGAGKSTTMRILVGLTQATSGVAKICGIPVATEALEAKKHLGYMPENNPLPEELRVIEYLRWRAKLKNVPRREISARVEAVMVACDLARKARRKLIGTLSKGFRQRVGIADALLSEPDVIILDEPTIGLDPHQIRGIRALIRSLRKQKAVLISSHILPEIENVCDRVIIINGGTVVAAGTPDELRKEFILTRTFSVETDAPTALVAAALGVEPPENDDYDDEADGNGEAGDSADAAEMASAAGTASESGAGTEGEGVNGGETVVPEKKREMRVRLVSVPASKEVVPENAVFALTQEGWRVREFREKRPTLEDIFIAATKRSYDIKE